MMNPKPPHAKTIALRFAAAALLCLGLGLGASCTGNERHVLPLTHTRYPQRASEYPIALTESDYDTPYVPLALVTSKPYYDSELEDAGSEELRAMARRLGGDAVIRISRNARVANEPRTHAAEPHAGPPQLEGKSTLSGIVVRFKDEE